MERIILGVYRNLGKPSDSPQAWYAHRLRSAALHEIFDNEPALQATYDPGVDDQKETHEFVELTVAWASSHAHALAVGAPAAVWLGGKLESALADKTAARLASLLIDKLLPEQRKKKIRGIVLRFGPGEKEMVAQCDVTPDGHVKIGLFYADGRSESFDDAESG